MFVVMNFEDDSKKIIKRKANRINLIFINIKCMITFRF